MRVCQEPSASRKGGSKLTHTQADQKPNSQTEAGQVYCEAPSREKLGDRSFCQLLSTDPRCTDVGGAKVERIPLST